MSLSSTIVIQKDVSALKQLNRNKEKNKATGSDRKINNIKISAETNGVGLKHAKCKETLVFPPKNVIPAFL